jgi:hypothetical protein
LARDRIVNGADFPAAIPQICGNRGVIQVVTQKAHAAKAHFAEAHGAIAQLGERVVRNDEVGGSIPPGSTSLRRLRLLRLGKPYRSEGCRAVARRAQAD